MTKPVARADSDAFDPTATSPALPVATLEPLRFTLLARGHTVRRREFIGLVGAAAWPVAARAQQEEKLPVIGLLGPTSAAAWVPMTNIFVSRLRQLGWIEGSTVAIEYRWAEGRYGRFAEVAAQFVRLKVDVIVTAATEPKFDLLINLKTAKVLGIVVPPALLARADEVIE